jgi:hypothetical protein
VCRIRRKSRHDAALRGRHAVLGVPARHKSLPVKDFLEARRTSLQLNGSASIPQTKHFPINRYSALATDVDTLSESICKSRAVLTWRCIHKTVGCGLR